MQLDQRIENPGALAGASNSIALGRASEPKYHNASETKTQTDQTLTSKDDRVRQKRAEGRPDLTRERVLELLNYDPKTGAFRHRKTRGGCETGTEAGTISPDGYRLLYIDYFQWRASRIAWLIMTGNLPPAGMLVDHRDGDRSRDAWENLRLATHAQNARNRGKCRRNTSGKVGVHPINDLLWGAEIGVNGKNVKLGRFECKEAAIEARCEAERHYFGAFRRAV